MASILVIEDERELNSMIADYLKALGYAVEQAYDGIKGFSLFRETEVSLIVLDIMLPGIDGIDLTRRIRGSSDIPIILLTAKSGEEDKVLGLDTGADDYVVKPFSLKELAARIRALLRRGVPGTKEKDVITVGSLEMDVPGHQLYRHGSPVDLTAVQFQLVKTFLSNPGRVFTRLELLNVFQEHAYEGYERTIDVHIKNIRKVIEEDHGNPGYIQTVWGVGYKLNPGPDAGKDKRV